MATSILGDGILSASFQTGLWKLLDAVTVRWIYMTMNVKMKAVKPMLTVASLEDTIAFYRDLLGFQCQPG